MQTKNAIALILANIFGGIVQFVSVSLYLRYLGKDVYSLYIVVSGIAGYLSLVVPDISNATQKLLISRLVTSRIKEISEVICTHKQVVLIYVSVAFLLFTLASIASLFLPISHKETVSISFALIGLSTMIGLFGTTKNCILVSLQKFTTIAIINAIAALFSSTFGIITAYFTRDLSSLFVSGITYNLVYLALINIAASQNLNIRDSRPKKEIRIDILKISYRAYWHKLVNFMAGGLDRLLLAKASTNIASVSDYYLSYRLPEVLSGIVSPGILTIVPKLTAQYESFPDLAAKSLSRYLFQASIVG
jgi:O-antigen/teichoic acid export membrane protein